jgi:predicted DNA binding CopG/RHH family protein
MKNIKRHLEYKENFEMFAKNEFYTFVPYGIEKVNPYKFQLELLEKIKDHQFNLIVQSRQIGLSSLLALYIAWYIMFNENKNVFIISNNSRVSQQILERVEDILRSYSLKDCFDFNKEIKKRTKSILELENSSRVFAKGPSVDAIKGHNIDLLVVDCAAFIKKLSEILRSAFTNISKNDSKIIISSAPQKNSQFNNLVLSYEEDENEFKKNSHMSLTYLPWTIIKSRDEAWFKRMSMMLNNDREKIDEEFNCVVKSEEHNQKTKTISLRLTNKLLFDIKNKIGEEGSISDYIRSLIDKDLES